MSFQKDKLVSVFGALCFFFSAVEYLFPKPLPFLRLGLANLPLLVALEVLGLKQFSLVVLIKVIGQGLIGGTLFSYVFLFSAAGTLSSAAIMYGLKKLLARSLGFTGISIAGALASNVVQLLLARFILFGKSAWLFAPPFLTLGTFTALSLGLFADYFTRNSRWFEAIKTEQLNRQTSLDVFSKTENAIFSPPSSSCGDEKKALVYFFAGLALLPLLLFSPSLLWTAGVFVCITLLLLISRRRFNLLSLLFMTVAIVFFHLLSPAGRVIFQLGDFRVTQTAFEGGLKKALTLGGMLLLSRWMIRPALKLPGKLGALVSQSFLVLERLTAQKQKINRKRLMKSIDEILEAATDQNCRG